MNDSVWEVKEGFTEGMIKVNGNKQRPTRGGEAKAIYAELARAAVSATIIRILAETQRQTEEGRSCTVEAGKAPSVP